MILDNIDWLNRASKLFSVNGSYGKLNNLIILLVETGNLFYNRKFQVLWIWCIKSQEVEWREIIFIWKMYL